MSETVSNPPAAEVAAPPRPADVTAIISTFNRAQYLPQALDSLLAQTRPLARIIVVDDGSTDDTAAVIAPYLDRVEYLRRENGGKARAINSVLPSVTTEYVWLFDDDDAAYPQAAADLLRVAEASPSLGFVFGGHDLVESDDDLLRDAAKRAQTKHYDHARASPARQRLELFRDCTVMMTGALLHTAAVHDAGGLNEQLLRCQDYDMLVRLAARRGFAYCGSSVYAWRDHGGARGTAQASHGNASRLAVWAKYNEPIGDFLRNDLTLDAFRDDDDYPSSQSARRAALLCRAWATAPKSALASPVADILEAVAAEPSLPLSTKESRWLQQTFHHDFVGFRRASDLLGLAPLRRVAVGRQALGQVVRGVYWMARNEPRRLDRWRWLLAAAVLQTIALSPI